jgi:hypothetical protein
MRYGFGGLTMAAVAALVLSASGAQARNLPTGGVTAQEVADALQTKGYRAEIGEDKGGDPKVTSALDGSRFTIWFYNCKNGRCASVQFESGFDLKDGMGLSKVNGWNKDKRFGSAYLDDESDPYVQYDVDFEVGATTEAITNAIDVWAAVVPQFKEYIGF